MVGDRVSIVGDLTGRKDTLARIVRILAKEGWHVEAEGKIYRQAGQFKVQVKSGIDWFELEGGLATKRKVSGQLSWWFGDFYTGKLDEVILTASWKPSPLFTRIDAMPWATRSISRSVRRSTRRSRRRMGRPFSLRRPARFPPRQGRWVHARVQRAGGGCDRLPRGPPESWPRAASFLP